MFDGNKSPHISPRDCQIWIDFDGTISSKDTLDELIKNFSIDDSWLLAEEQWSKGLIGSRQCLEKEFALLRITPDTLNDFLSKMKIDMGLFQILNLCEKWSIPITVVSDGIDLFITKILNSNGVFNLTIRSNTIIHEDNRITLVCPHHDSTCGVKAAHCKCSSMRELGIPGKHNIYIGDGRSDLCPARHADIVFAKNALANCLRKEGIPFTEFHDLGYVADSLSETWKHSVSVARVLPRIMGKVNTSINRIIRYNRRTSDFK